jgi:hypothetical protein
MSMCPMSRRRCCVFEEQQHRWHQHALHCHVSDVTHVRGALAGTVSAPSGLLPTIGGAFIDIRGRYLGLASSAIAVLYTGGSIGFATRSYTIERGACTVVGPGTLIACPSQPGVGANYTFTVLVDGGASAVSSGMLSYAPPIINSVDGPGAVNSPARGGVHIQLNGVRRNFM